jgi:DNA-binding NarL/FixJ family response regulator
LRKKGIFLPELYFNSLYPDKHANKSNGMDQQSLNKRVENITNILPDASSPSSEDAFAMMNSRQLHNIITLSTGMNQDVLPAFFSKREKSIIKLICQEKSSKQIAILLSINQRTIERVRMRILQKMKVKSAAGIAIYALRNGILTFQELVNKSITFLCFISYLSE